jgi:hypothetical protein
MMISCAIIALISSQRIIICCRAPGGCAFAQSVSPIGNYLAHNHHLRFSGQYSYPAVCFPCPRESSQTIASRGGAFSRPPALRYQFVTIV